MLLTINVDGHRKAADLILKRSPRHHLQQGPGPPLPQQCAGRLIRQQEGLRRLGGRCELLPLVQAGLEGTPVLTLRQSHQGLAPPVQRRRANLSHGQLSIHPRLASPLAHQPRPHAQHLAIALQLRTGQALLLQTCIHRIPGGALRAGGQQPALGLVLPEERASIDPNNSIGRRLVRQVLLQQRSEPLGQRMAFAGIQQTGWTLQLSQPAGMAARRRRQIREPRPGVGAKGLPEPEAPIHRQG